MKLYCTFVYAVHNKLDRKKCKNAVISGEFKKPISQFLSTHDLGLQNRNSESIFKHYFWIRVADAVSKPVLIIGFV